MLDDPLKTFTENLYKLLLGRDIVVNGLLVKKHSVNLQEQGEFSFTNTAKSWREYLNENETDLSDRSFLKHIGKEAADITHASETWQLPVKVATEIKDRVHLYLDRGACIEVAAARGERHAERLAARLAATRSLTRVDARCAPTCVTFVRLQCIKEAIDSLIAINSTRLPDSPKVFVTSKSTSGCTEGRLFLCGPVLNANTNAKENTLSGEDYIRLRQNELTLIAQHKYGLRAISSENWKEFIAHLGESAVTFEMLQTKPSCAVKINFDVSSGSSKGAAFILYNCARLETIMRTYNERVSEGTYPPLPDFENTNFTLLTQEDEWCLIFNYILGLPNLLKSCVEINENSCDFRPHLVCGFLSAMVKSISQYYRRTRILTEPRKHLLPVMFARLRMLKLLNETLKICLRILNIKSVAQM